MRVSGCIVCADDHQERNQRHRDHLDARDALGLETRPAHAPPLMVHVNVVWVVQPQLGLDVTLCYDVTTIRRDQQ
jgi:hypothetical protein